MGGHAHDPGNPEDSCRDRFILSKGHAAPALYAVLSHYGYFPKEELTRSQKLDRDVLADSMETLIAKDAFPYYEEILSPGGGIQTELPILLAEYPFTTPGM